MIIWSRYSIKNIYSSTNFLTMILFAYSKSEKGIQYFRYCNNESYLIKYFAGTKGNLNNFSVNKFDHDLLLHIFFLSFKDLFLIALCHHRSYIQLNDSWHFSGLGIFQSVRKLVFLVIINNGKRFFIVS